MKRLASTSTSALVAKRNKSNPRRRTYFDLLPFELLVRFLQVIAQRDIDGYFWTDDLMSFGRTSERNKAAVLEAMKHRIDVYKCYISLGSMYSLFETMVQFFGNDLREINFLYPQTVQHGAAPILRVLKQPITSLRKAKIAGRKSHFELIYGNKSLTHLEITFCRRFRMTWKSLSRSLKSLTLTNLTLHISPDFQVPTVNTLARVASACPGVRELRFGPTESADYVRWWGLIIGLPHLEKLSITGKVFPSIFMDRLSGIRELKITGSLPIDSILRYESNIVHLRPLQVCSRENIAKLQSFTNLRTLVLEIEAGAEIEVPSTVYNLEALHLKWPCDTYPVQHQRRINADLYYHANVQALISIVRNATQVRDLALFCVYLPDSAITEVIKIMGKNLRVLHTHIDFQKSHPGKRLQVVLQALAAYCPRIKKLHLFNPCYCIPAKRKEKDRWLTALRVARDKCPDLDLNAISFYLTYTDTSRRNWV